jgi:hypothetical protein
MMTQLTKERLAESGKKALAAGEQSISTDASGKAAFTFKPSQKVPRGQFVSATAGTPGADSINTSEFSAAKKVVRPR